MAHEPKKSRSLRKPSDKVPTHEVHVSLVLKGHVVDNEVMYALPVALSIPGRCAGKPDDTPCGPGCRCLAGQPHYDLATLSAAGVAVGSTKKLDT